MVLKRRHRTKRRKTMKRRARKVSYTVKKSLKTYRDLEKKIDKTWRKLRTDVKKRSRRAIIKGRRDLLLLLGECNYMARECARCMKVR